jgi:hypothetical protein
MAEKLDLHLLELARPEREIARRDLVAETLADLGDAERHADAAAVQHVLEVHEDSLSRLGAEKRRPFLAGQRANIGLEHQIEFARLGQRPQRLGVRPEDARRVVDLRKRQERSVPGQLVGILGSQPKVLQRPCLDILLFLLRFGHRRHENPLALGLTQRPRT